MPYSPRFTTTPAITRSLLAIERARTAVDLLPIPLGVEKRLRREARVRVAHNSTWIENRTLTLDEARRVIEDKAQRDASRSGSQAAAELRNYWAALEFIDRHPAASGAAITEQAIRELHAVIYRGTRGPGRPPSATPYRSRNIQVGNFEYLPPEAKDVPRLMREFVSWLQGAERELPGPVLAAVAAYQFVTIHPFEDGNGRTCRAVATLILKRTGYGLKGLASVESFYARDLPRYYASLQMGLHPNYYEANARGSRSDPDLTPWVEYFLDTFSQAATELREVLERESRPEARAVEAYPLPFRQLLGEMPDLQGIFTPNDVAAWFGVTPKTARHWLSQWLEQGLVEPTKPDTQRVRAYRIPRRVLEDLGEAP